MSSVLNERSLFWSEADVALAPALSTLTGFARVRAIFRLPASHLHWRTAFDQRLSYHSNPSKTTRSASRTSQESKEGGGAASLIENLLPNARSQEPTTLETTTPEVSTSDTVKADFVGEVRRIERLSANEQWRVRRSTLRGETRYDAAGESTRQGRHSLGWSQEIVFAGYHRKLLEPPYQDKFRIARALDYVSEKKMRSYVQVLTTPTADTPGTTLLLHFDNKRYLIGSLAEGTQRACVQMGAGLLKVSECFVTGRTEWSNVGGLLGMILTLADSAASSHESSLEQALLKAKSKATRLGFLDDAVKMKELEDEARRSVRNNALTLFAPPNLNHTLATARRFIFRKGMPVNVHEIHENTAKNDDEKWAPYWADDNIKVWAMSINPSPQTDSSEAQRNSNLSSRKRSIDEVNDEEKDTSNGGAAGDLTPAERDQLTVKAVVSEMFNSSWRLDTLYETPLSQVHMPASIFIRNPDTNKVEKYHGPLPGGEQPLPNPDLEVLVRRPWPGALVESLPHTEPAKEAVSYIIRNHTQRGKFNPQRAKELKVEMGHKWSQLSAGLDVTNIEGRTVTPDEVLGESKEGGGLAVVDLPDASYIDNLISRPEWKEPKVMAGVGAIFWICGPGVATDSRIHDFMKTFNHLEHVVSSPDYCSNYIAMESSAAATIRQRMVDPARYGIPVHSESPETVDGPELSPLPKHGVRLAVRGQMIQLEPSFKLLEDEIVPPLSITQVEAEMSQDVLDEAANAHIAIESAKNKETAWAANIPDKDAEIITLGTGSALPSKYRNVSATLVLVPGWGNMLFDCGENTLGQLKRVFTPKELKEVLRDLKIIFISHMHADHHLGTVGVIKAWYNEVHNAQPAPLATHDSDFQLMFEGTKRLSVISEPAMLHWLLEYSAVEDYGYSRIAPLTIDRALVYKDSPSVLGWAIKPSDFANLTATLEDRVELRTRNTIPASLLNLRDVQAVRVVHCHGARAFSVTLPSGFKVSYSGDCRPSKAFAAIGKGSTVCIHEATFDDELQVDAEAKNHSTTSEALVVAQAMGAKTCVLTHFSQRYQKLPVLEHGNGNGNGSAQGTANGEGKDVSLYTPMFSAAEEEHSTDPEYAASGPIEDAAATFPDQITSNGAGQQYDIPSKRGDKRRGSIASGPTAVKLKLASDMKVTVAFDYMRVKVGEIGQMEKFTPALLKLFADEEEKKDVAAVSSKKSKKEKKKEKARNPG